MVSLSGINVSMPFIIMRHWEEWNQYHTISIDEMDKRLCQLIMNIQFTCQQHFFGSYWEKYFERSNDVPLVIKRHTTQMKNRFWSLPEEFFIDDIVDICGVKYRSAEKMVERWTKDHYIERIDNGFYRKNYLELP